MATLPASMTTLVTMAEPIIAMASPAPAMSITFATLARRRNLCATGAAVFHLLTEPTSEEGDSPGATPNESADPQENSRS